MSVKHLKYLWLIVALLMTVAPRFALAKDAGVVLERAQVSAASMGGFLQVDVTVRSQLSAHVDAIELSIECNGETPLVKMGRRPMVLAPGSTISAFLSLAGPQVKPSDCSVSLLGYRLKQPNHTLLKKLLRTGYSADERAVVLAVIEANGPDLDFQTWIEPSPSQIPDVPEVLERLLGWFAIAQQSAKHAETLPKVDGVERLDQPLQVVLTARERGSSWSSPIAHLLPDGVSTMKDAWTVFRKGEFRPVEALSDFEVEVLKQNPPQELDETSNFYRTLSWLLFGGIIIWALWGLRRKTRLKGSNDV